MSGTVGSVELILFDAVGTLIYPDPPVGQAYYEVGRKFGSQLSPAEIDVRFAGAFRKSCQSQQDERPGKTNEAHEYQRWQAIVREVFRETAESDAHSIFEQLWQHFAQPKNWRLYADVSSTIAALQSRGRRAGIASNFDNRLLGLIRALAPLDQLKPVFVSSQVGWSKPAADFYCEIERVTKLPAERLMLIGDNWENDFAPPQRLGWQTRWLRRAATAVLPGQYRTLSEACADL